MFDVILQKISEKFSANAEVIFITSAFFLLCWLYALGGRWRRAGLMLGLAGLVALLYGGLLAWFYGLGGDSFLESSDFNWSEAWHWLKSFLSSIPYMAPSPKIWAFIMGMGLLLCLPLLWLIRRYKYAIHAVFGVLLLGHLSLAHTAYRGYTASRHYVQAIKDQFQEPITGIGQAADVDLIVYVGESTSSLNMGLYGYPLETTPQLNALQAKDEGFLRFDHVRSTQSHTSVSLLRALSVPSPKATAQQRWGLGQLLNQAGVKAKLYSVQPLTGSFATFSRFIFDGMEYELNADDKYKGNMTAPVVKDHELIPQVLSRAGVTVFHSYAGHGNYLNLIDQGLSRAVPLPSMSFQGMVGAGFSVLDTKMVQEVEDYNRAMTYIDRNVAEVLRGVQSRAKPAVGVYFADHGDSVFTKRSHESSQFIDEMTTVPFVLYFNEAYRQKYPEVFARYQAAAKRKDLKLLDQVVPTLLDVLRIESEYPLSIPTMAQDKPHPHPVIMERDTLQGPSRLDFRYDEAKGFGDFKFSGGTPEPTLTWMINDKYKDPKTICYHRADSYAKALRAASVADCIEFDLVVEGEKLSVYHPPAVATGFEIEHIFSIAAHRKNKLWIDSKNLDDPAACQVLKTYLEKNQSRVGEIFVEFPAGAVAHLKELRACALDMKKMGVKRSYYVPTHSLVPCAQDSVKNKLACQSLHADVSAAMDSGLFSDLSFDFAGYSAMQRLDGAKRFGWNTWTVKPQDFHKFPRQDFNYIIMDTGTDPNTY